MKSPLTEAFLVFTSGRPIKSVVLANASLATLVNMPLVVNVLFQLTSSKPMQPRNLAAFEQLISTPRLESYRRYFQMNSPEQAIALTMWNCELGACFSALVSFLEIALRNNTHSALSRQFCAGAVTGHWYDVISLNARALVKPRDPHK